MQGDDVKDAGDHRSWISPSRLETVLRGREVRHNKTGLLMGKTSLCAGVQKKKKSSVTIGLTKIYSFALLLFQFPFKIFLNIKMRTYYEGDHMIYRIHCNPAGAQKLLVFSKLDGAHK